MGRVRDRGVPRDACNNRSAASCTHPIPENRAFSFRFSARSTILARTLITRQVPIAIGISLLTKPAFQSLFTLLFSKNFHREVYYRPSSFVRSFERSSFPYDWWIIISSK